MRHSARSVARVWTGSWSRWTWVALGGGLVSSLGCSLSLGVDDYAFERGGSGGGVSTGRGDGDEKDPTTIEPLQPSSGGSSGRDERPATASGGMAGSGGDTPPGEPAPVVPPIAAGACPGQGLSFDEAYALIAEDLSTLDPVEAGFTRYVSVANRFGAGACEVQLEADRSAIAKALNSLSLEALIVTPLPINTDRLIYRFDLRDLDWDRRLSVGGANFTDVWEALIAQSPFAVPLSGKDAADAAGITGTSVPLVFSNALIDVAMVGEPYYRLVGVDPDASLEDFILTDLAIDVAQNLEDENTVRAGTTLSGAGASPVSVERHDIEVRQGILWQEVEVASADALFRSPFDPIGERRVIFTLPNGLFAFVVANDGGGILPGSASLTDGNQRDQRAITSVSCSNCHKEGLIGFPDEVRTTLLASASDLGLNTEEIARIESVYPEVNELARIIERDNTTFFETALSGAGVSSFGPEPISTVFSQFRNDVDLATAAGELGVQPAQLIENLSALPGRLSTLARGGSITREDWASLYLDSLCVMLLSSENQPYPGLCETQ